MQLYDKLLRPISEVKYLSAENYGRYRVIMRYFFEEYESINYWHYKEDVFAMMEATGHFSEYTIEKCQSDLESLTEWGNLIGIQDTTKVTTIEQYRNKRFRYQMTEYAVEIERMIIKLENLEVEGASLEASLLERLYQQLLQYPAILEVGPESIATWWRSLDRDFVQLNQNYQDYIRTLNSHKSEEMMRSDAFLMYKDQLIEYLRTFVRNLQEFGGLIGSHLEKYSHESYGNRLLAELVDEELRTPRLDKTVDEKELRKLLTKRWINLNNWFVGRGDTNELNRMYDMTNDIIRRITRYAGAIVSRGHQNANRKEEYRHLAKIFQQCEDINVAHKLSASVFGVSSMLHLLNLDPRVTDDIDSGVFAETPTELNLEIKSRMAKSKTVRKNVEDVEIAQRMQRLEIEEKQREEQKILNSYILNGRIEFKNLPEIDGNSRKILLSWLSKGLANSDHRARTDTGQYYYVDVSLIKETVELQCVDGAFKMPNLSIVFESQQGLKQ